MISILAPSKTMDLTTPPSVSVVPERPLFLAEATTIAAKLASLSHARLKALMRTSDELTSKTHATYAAWSAAAAGKPALWAYKGDVYKGFYADKLNQAEADWAQAHLLIASGLYGLLRPYDGVQAYRLEMKAKLAVADQPDLYAYWGDKLATYVRQRAGQGGTVCCLSSEEYARAILRHLPSSIRVVTPVFYDVRPGSLGIGTAPIYNKMMRGVVARWLIDQRADRPEALADFSGHGYRYDATRSTADRPAFFRPEMKPLVF